MSNTPDSSEVTINVGEDNKPITGKLPDAVLMAGLKRVCKHTDIIKCLSETIDLKPGLEKACEEKEVMEYLAKAVDDHKSMKQRWKLWLPVIAAIVSPVILVLLQKYFL